MDTFSLIPGTIPENAGPLARFLPPLEDGVVTAWLRANTNPGSWVLDPFGTAPQLVLEAARAGYRVLVSANNPITRFILEIGASSYPEMEFRAALADLAVSQKGSEKLESHLQSLYMTPCIMCGREVPAQAFIWQKEEQTPLGRIYECEECGESGEKGISPTDIERSIEIGRSAGLARARVLERVAPLNDPDREFAEEAINHYLPRSIYVLATLINRLDGLHISEDRKRALTALILSACDKGNTLWPHPTERPRPKQLSTPPKYQERNIWLDLEEAIKIWAGVDDSVPCLRWSEKDKKTPESGGILLYRGKIKDLADVVQDTPIMAVIGSIPRQNQAFWTLSALWAGWLWGKVASDPFKVALRRRRYDWGWQTMALHAALHHVCDLLPRGTPAFGLLAEPEAGFLSATLVAASTAGFDFRAQAMRTEHDPVQLVWQRGERSHQKKKSTSLQEIRDAMHEHLSKRGEPSTYLHLHAAGLAPQAVNQGLIRPEQDFDEALREIHSNTQQAIQSDLQLERIDDPDRSLEIGLWGLQGKRNQLEPLADRVEQEIVHFLRKKRSCELLEIERGIYPKFPGLLAPSKALVSAVLSSYAVYDSGQWRLRIEDHPATRRAEIEKIAKLIAAIGDRLQYQTEQIDDKTYLWTEDGRTDRVFYLIVSALVGRVLSENQFPSSKCLLVIPGGRASLLAYKQNRDPRLLQLLEGWHIVKFRLLRALTDIPVLNRQTFDEQLITDPIEQKKGQLMMF